MNEQALDALVESGVVSSAQIAEAKAASGNDASFNRHLLRISGVDEGRFFSALSDVYKMPYVELGKLDIPASAKQFCSEHCLKRWNILPLDVDLKHSIVTVAVGSPEQAENIERYLKFLMEPYDMGFVLTDESSLSEFVAHACKPRKPDAGGVQTAEDGQRKPDAVSPQKPQVKKKIIIPVSARKPPAKKEAKTTASITGTKTASQTHSGAVESIPDELATSLTSAISLLVHAHIGSDPDALAAVKERVRYCQLTASRLGLTPIESTKVVLAAWLSSLASRRDVISQFACPFDLEAILFADESDSELGIDALILSLVNVYQKLKKEIPDSARDVGFARRGLFMRWPLASRHQDILEIFLQVLMDEQFVEKLDMHSGRVCILASGGGSGPVLVDALDRSGYSVKNVSLFEELEALVQGNGADLLIVNTAGSGKHVVPEIKRIKESPTLGSIPLMAAIGPGGAIRGADLLRAGVDDFISDPIDMEILLLKADKLLKSSSTQQGSGGVSGSLADMSFSDLVQVISAGGKNMDVTVTHEAQSGRIMLQAGSIVHAEAGKLIGEQAFYAMMQWKTGQFSVSECDHFPEQTVTASTMSLLMEGARLADEGAAQH